ncbi:hypothetical protein hrd7_06180 [Leptolinea sp. HRD-7]|nr:hypothetical protein hrd7_06180 [Leptolinea sp. HRD-7]
MDNSTGIVADGIGVAVPGMDVEVNKGAGVEVSFGSAEVGVTVAVIGRLQADATMPNPMIVRAKNDVFFLSG